MQIIFPCSTSEAAHYHIVQKTKNKLKTLRTKQNQIKKAAQKCSKKIMKKVNKIKQKLKLFPY